MALLTSTIRITNNLREPLTYINATIVEGGWANAAQPQALINANTTTRPIILNPVVGGGSSATITYRIGGGSQVTLTFTCSKYSDNDAAWLPSTAGEAYLIPPDFNLSGPLEAHFYLNPPTQF